MWAISLIVRDRALALETPPIPSRALLVRSEVIAMAAVVDELLPAHLTPVQLGAARVARADSYEVNVFPRFYSREFGRLTALAVRTLEVTVAYRCLLPLRAPEKKPHGVPPRLLAA